MLTWALCVATLDRIDILEACVNFALAQTRPPSEVIIVDASDAWELHRDRIAALTGPKCVPLIYLAAAKRSSAAQRNQGIREARADILFLIDDDSLLYPDAASVVMDLYEAATGHSFVAIGLTSRPAPPSGIVNHVKTRESTSPGRAAVRLLRFPMLNWVYRELFLLTLDRLFLTYSPHPNRFSSEYYPSEDYPGTWHTAFIGGYALTVRRNCALAEPFNPHLLGYCPMEDLDAVYRWSRTGFTLYAGDAGVHHCEVNQSRINRRKVTQLQLSNLAFFVRYNSRNRTIDSARVVIRLIRRVFAEFLKDAGTLRLSFPQFRGALVAVPAALRILTLSQDMLPKWYERYQSILLWDRSAPRPGPGALNSSVVQNGNDCPDA